MRARLVFTSLLTALLVLVAAEVLARHMRLDLRSGEAIAVASAGPKGLHARAGGLGADGEPDFLPRGFKRDAQGFDSGWGRCDFDHPGPTVLALGDSTTRQSARPGYQGQDSQPDDRSEWTWPAQLSALLSPEVQVCVLAEDGYHPHDLALLAPEIIRRLQPVTTVYLMCSNDLQERPQRLMVEIDEDWLSYHQAPSYSLVWRPLYQPWLLKHSEAFRFAHHRLAQDSAWAIRIPLDVPYMQPVPALQELERSSQQLQVFYLPEISEQQTADLQRRLEGIVQSSGVAIRPVQLPQPKQRFRRESWDTVHLNRDGHALVADAILQQLPQELGR